MCEGMATANATIVEFYQSDPGPARSVAAPTHTRVVVRPNHDRRLIRESLQQIFASPYGQLNFQALCHYLSRKPTIRWVYLGWFSLKGALR